MGARASGRLQGLRRRQNHTMSMTFVSLLAAGWLGAGQVPTITADGLWFLAGCWRAEQGGRVVEEQWMAPGRLRARVEGGGRGFTIDYTRAACPR